MPKVEDLRYRLYLEDVPSRILASASGSEEVQGFYTESEKELTKDGCVVGYEFVYWFLSEHSLTRLQIDPTNALCTKYSRAGIQSITREYGIKHDFVIRENLMRVRLRIEGINEEIVLVRPEDGREHQENFVKLSGML